MSKKPTPPSIIGRALLLYLLSTVVMWIITFILDGFKFSIPGALYLFGSVINSIFFLAYLLWYVDALSKRGLIAFLPFVISVLFLIKLLYGFAYGNLAEMAWGMRSSIVRPWHWRCAETLVVLFVCLGVYKKYFRLSRAAAIA